MEVDECRHLTRMKDPTCIRSERYKCSPVVPISLVQDIESQYPPSWGGAPLKDSTEKRLNVPKRYIEAFKMRENQRLRGRTFGQHAAHDSQISRARECLEQIPIDDLCEHRYPGDGIEKWVVRELDPEEDPIEVERMQRRGKVMRDSLYYEDSSPGGIMNRQRAQTGSPSRKEGGKEGRNWLVRWCITF